MTACRQMSTQAWTRSQSFARGNSHCQPKTTATWRTRVSQHHETRPQRTLTTKANDPAASTQTPVGSLKEAAVPTPFETVNKECRQLEWQRQGRISQHSQPVEAAPASVVTTDVLRSMCRILSFPVSACTCIHMHGGSKAVVEGHGVSQKGCSAHSSTTHNKGECACAVDGAPVRGVEACISPRSIYESRGSPSC